MNACSLDKELVKLAEKSAREREKREREKREREVREKAEAEAAAAEVAKNQIQVKPIIETVSPSPKPLAVADSYSRKMSSTHKHDDLLRFVRSFVRSRRNVSSV